MRTLTKIKLINWHFFTNITIPIEGSALITGDNGAGKSTLIDALQMVLIANLKEIKFNSSAFEERTTRDLRGYLRGKTGTEGNTFLRGEHDDFSSYLVLEITHSSSQQAYLIGVVFDYSAKTGEEDHIFFKIDEYPLEDDLFLQGNVPRNRQSFFHHLKTKGIKFSQYRNDIEGYRSDLRQLFGGCKEAFFSLLGKGISFSPITHLRNFVYEFILEENPVDVETMRDYFERYRRMENLILETEREIAALEQIATAFAQVEDLRQTEQIGRYMQYRGSWEQKILELGESELQKQHAREELEKLRKNLESLAKEKIDLTNEIGLIEQKLRDHEISRKIDLLNQKIAYLENKIKELEGRWTNLRQLVQIEVREQQQLVEILRNTDAPFEYSQTLMEGLEDWGFFLGENEHFPQNIEKQARYWHDSIIWLKLEEKDLKERKKQLGQEASELEISIHELEKNQVIGSSSPTMKLKKLLQEHLLPENGQGPVPVHVFCEAIEIQDSRWQDAIEGYLHTQKFDLLVPPGYFDEALSIYERYKFTYNIENVGLVNTEKLLKEARPAMQNSLAEVVIAQEDYIAAYTNWLLGAVIKCENEQQLKLHQRAITPTCMLYQNHTARQIPRKRYEIPYIGAQAIRYQLTQKREQLRATHQDIAKLNIKLESIQKAFFLVADKTDRYEVWKKEFDDCRQRDSLNEELQEARRELLSQDRTELERLEKWKQEKVAELDKCSKSIEDQNRKEGGYEENLKNILQSINNLSVEEKHNQELYLNYLQGLPPELKEKAGQKWEQEIRQKTPVELERNYRLSSEGLSTKIANKMVNVARLRTDFVNEFHFSGDPEAPDNKSFHDRYLLLTESHLLDYKEESQKAREQAEQAFKEHFVASLKERIETARLEVDELNRALRDLRFSGNSYRFQLNPKTDMRDYYDMIMDPNLYMGETLFSQAFREKHGDTVERLFGDITTDEESFQEKMQTLTDYRSYLDFEIAITDEQGHLSYFSKVLRDKSGGETQVPFYVTVLGVC